MRPVRFATLTAVLLCIGFVAAACGGDEGSDLTAPSATDESEATSTTSIAASDAGEYEPIDESGFDEDLQGAVYETYLNLMNAADIYRVNPEAEENFIDEVGGSEVIAELDRQRAEDLSVSDIFLPIEMESQIDDPEISLADDQVTLTDCVEQTLVDSDGDEIIKFVDQTVTMRMIDGYLWVESLTVNHPGGSFEGIGCTQKANGQHALAVAEQFYAALAPAQADPAAGLPADLEVLLSESTNEEFRGSLEELVTDGQRVQQDGVEVSYRILGRDGDVLGDNVVVELCTKFVNGLQLVSTTGGASTEVFVSGTAKTTNLTVWSNGGDWKIIDVGRFIDGECG